MYLKNYFIEYITKPTAKYGDKSPISCILSDSEFYGIGIILEKNVPKIFTKYIWNNDETSYFEIKVVTVKI